MTLNPPRPRISDVARLAGVSETTVSVVLNNAVGDRVRVSKATQERVWEAVRQLGYVANPVAQRLAGGQNKIVAVFTFEPIFPIDSRNFYYPFLIGLEEEADRDGYDLLLVTGSGNADGKRRIYQDGVNRLQRADGAVLLGHGDPHEINRLLRDQYPFVYVGRRDSTKSASAEVAGELLALGHQNIVYVRSARTTEASLDRERGVRQALGRASGDDGWVWQGTPDSLTVEGVRAWLDGGVTALIAEDESLGLRVMQCATEAGRRCPHDYSMAVLGNPLNPLTDVPDWMTFSIPRREMGRDAFAMLRGWLTGDAKTLTFPLRKTLACTFIPGSTTRRLTE
ncbi:MAG: LacI family transcriptional regulator [Anaerolineae bacterium]|nr:LacI family transcriptional regulator [Anaerolineae bacterium]